MDSRRDKTIEGEPTSILIMGGPDAGKGTMSAKIVKEFNVSHISTGDIFHSETGRGTAPDTETKSFTDKGLLVPGEVTNNMVKSYLEKLEDKKNGLLLDGYPRTLDQARAFDALAGGSELATDKVIAPGIDFEESADRVTRRRIYKECRETYHIKSKPGKIDNVCDVCGGGLFQRKDDTVESLTAYLEEYSSQMAPALGYYDSKGIITRIDTSQLIDSVWNDTLTALEK